MLTFLNLTDSIEVGKMCPIHSMEKNLKRLNEIDNRISIKVDYNLFLAIVNMIVDQECHEFEEARSRY
uniref:Uncharacterized protein n=1 Tax=Romanomermis culicivorax TaxID=13658 RepID=A0A915JWW6_ROMCU